MTNYLKLFSSVAEQDAFRDGNDYVEPHVSCIEDGSSVKYNKRPLGYDIELDTSEGSECDGRKITYFSNRIGPAEENYNENFGVYNYNVSNPNVTTDPVQSLKVNVINSDGYDGIYELPLVSHDEGGNSWSLELESNALWLSVHVYLNDETYVLNSVLTAGC